MMEFDALSDPTINIVYAVTVPINTFFFFFNKLGIWLKLKLQFGAVKHFVRRA